jgi:glycine hydroxymethyltransferase
LNSDLAQRYGDYTGRDLAARRYFGVRHVVELETRIAAVAAEVFGAAHVELRTLSGHVAGNAVILGLCRPGDLVLELDRESGGHRLATKLAAVPLAPLQVEFLPFEGRTFNIPVERTLELVEKRRPRLIILGASNFLFPHPVQALAKGLRGFPDTILAYDASHVLGLMAGSHFQAPLAEGAQLFFGGTQKSLPGPQGGLIASNSPELIAAVSAAVHPGLISNHHLARLPALGLALYEMKYWGRAYAEQVVRNARALGAALASHGVPVVLGDQGCTASHTLLLATSDLGEAGLLGQRLEEMDIIVSAIALPHEWGRHGLRLGVAEITRRGADEPLMAEVGAVLADVLFNRRAPEQCRSQVGAIAEQLQGYCFTWDRAPVGADLPAAEWLDHFLAGGSDALS